MHQWFIIETEVEYEAAVAHYEKVKGAEKNTPEHKEKMLLAKLISDYETKTSILPDLDPVEFIKIRMEDFGYKASDLAEIYGDKGTVSKVLNNKQALSLTMVRKFSQLLRIPPAMLIKEYELKIH
jgi:HTH-type transcriptional regulator/antitoxin HigA